VQQTGRNAGRRVLARDRIAVRCYYAMFLVSLSKQETQLPLTNRAMRLEFSQRHQTWYHSIC